MNESLDIEIPRHLPAITLPNTVLFPQVILPLHIFEERYQQMVRDSLERDRIFAVLTLKEEPDEDDMPNLEPPYSIASAGIIRACQDLENGHSNLIVQGLCRIRVEGILQEEPYRKIAIRPLSSDSTGSPEADLSSLRSRLLGGLHRKQRLGAPVTQEIMQFLKDVKDPEVVADLVAFSLCPEVSDRLALLANLKVEERLRQLIRLTEKEIAELLLRNQLQGGLEDGDIEKN
ncbi:MAG: LON peptidase substrate-binding domain-containing protein [Opitutales bacterium]|nr:LON peptidase substrate-binding domain-containing protein [Opitutales bacterium]MCH8540390.1 LON peptidase substrate-binding domain-containing protein [Opitutales bacterium]